MHRSLKEDALKDLGPLCCSHSSHISIPSLTLSLLSPEAWGEVLRCPCRGPLMKGEGEARRTLSLLWLGTQYSSTPARIKMKNHIALGKGMVKI